MRREKPFVVDSGILVSFVEHCSSKIRSFWSLELSEWLFLFKCKESVFLSLSHLSHLFTFNLKFCNFILHFSKINWVLIEFHVSRHHVHLIFRLKFYLHGFCFNLRHEIFHACILWHSPNMLSVELSLVYILFYLNSFIRINACSSSIKPLSYRRNIHWKVLVLVFIDNLFWRVFFFWILIYVPLFLKLDSWLF